MAWLPFQKTGGQITLLMSVSILLVCPPLAELSLFLVFDSGQSCQIHAPKNLPNFAVLIELIIMIQAHW